MAIKAQASKQTTKITVQQSNKNLSIELGQSNQNLPIELGQSAQHYNNLAKQWAISPNIVENLDYSSKYYAEISKQKTQEIVEQIESGKVVLDELKETKTNSIQELNNQTNSSITSIRAENNECINNIFATSDEAIIQLTSVKTNYIDEIDAVKNSSIDEIENTSAKEQEELTKIKDEAIQVKEELIQGGMFKFQLFDTKTTDRILSYEETFGWALQGTYVYSTAIVGERYGYPNFIERCIKEKNEATATSVTLGSNTLTIYKHSNGHQFYNIADKSKVDAFYNTYGVADYYGVDEANECVFLPRNKWFIQLTDSTANVNKFTEAGLPNITGTLKFKGVNKDNDCAGALKGSSFANTNTWGGSGTGQSLSFDFKASNSNAIYGKSSTVQPQSSLKLLYYCVGNTKADTSWINLVEQVEGCVKEIYDEKIKSLEDINTLRQDSVNEIDTLRQDGVQEVVDIKNESLIQLDKITSNGLQSLTGASNAITRNQITNCWTKIPQRIKYTLADGALTILAGTVAIFPYGTEDLTEQYPIGSTFLNDNLKVVDTYWDGSKFFVWAEMQANKEVTKIVSASSSKLFFAVIMPNGAIDRNPNHESGDGSSFAVTWEIYYNTTTNYVNRINNSAVVGTNCSLPVLACNADNTNLNWDSVQHTFNGWGYIGNAKWYEALEGLISNGYNNDGTYKNIVVKTPKLTIETYANTTTRDFVIFQNGGCNSPDHTRCFHQEEEPNITGTTSNNWYNPKANKTYQFNGANWIEKPNLKLYTYKGNGTNITAVTDTPQTFRPVDYFELTSSLKEVVVLTETYKNGTSWYRIYSDGWCEQGGYTTASNQTITFLKSFKDTSYYFGYMPNKSSHATSGGYYYYKSATVSSITIVDSADTIARGTKWYACGYIK